MASDMSTLFVAAIGALGGGTVVFAVLWSGAKHLAEKWLDHKFAVKLQIAEREFERQMKQAERDHDVIVRQLQSSIDRELERATKLHSKEFEVLAEAWQLIYVAYYRTRWAVSRAQKINDFSLMTPRHADEFIELSEALPPFAKAEIRELGSPELKNAYYREKLDRWECPNFCV